MHRLFVALRPPAAVRAGLLSIMGGGPGARWQSDDQLHLTLRFVGEVERPVAEDVAAALAGIRHAAIEAAIDGVGTFDRRGRVDALWAGLAPPEPLAALHRKVDQACVRAGLPPERRAYRPHVTLARFSGGGGPPSAFLQAHATLSSERFRVDHLILFESHLSAAGALYEPVLRVPLAG